MHEITKAKLEKKLQQLLKRVKEIDADLSQAPDDDWEERAAEVEEEEAQSAIGNLANKEIDQIRHALMLIETGRYGVCAKCGKEIAKARIDAIPYAVTCIACSE